MLKNTHGHITTEWVDALMVTHVYGPFNLDGVNASFEQLKESIEQRGLKSWCRLDILDTDTLGGPDVMRTIGNSYEWGFNRGCVGLATVYSTLIQRDIYQDYRRATGFNMSEFTVKEEAMYWCYEQLYKQD